MSCAKPGDWVQIEDIVLAAGERAPQVPPETAKVPLQLKLRGFLVDKAANIGEPATIRTLAGRTVSGVLSAVQPRYEVDYGTPQPELLVIGQELRALLGGNERV